LLRKKVSRWQLLLRNVLPFHTTEFPSELSRQHQAQEQAPAREQQSPPTVPNLERTLRPIPIASGPAGTDKTARVMALAAPEGDQTRMAAQKAKVLDDQKRG
jgi:hypothetical protein